MQSWYLGGHLTYVSGGLSFLSANAAYHLWVRRHYWMRLCHLFQSSFNTIWHLGVWVWHWYFAIFPLSRSTLHICFVFCRPLYLERFPYHIHFNMINPRRQIFIRIYLWASHFISNWQVLYVFLASSPCTWLFIASIWFRLSLLIGIVFWVPKETHI